MTDYISRKAAIEAVKNERNYTGKYSFEEEHAWSVGFQQGITFALSDICAIPAADVREVKRGKWLLEREPDGTPYCFHCSVCDDDFSIIGITTKYNFCPNCGSAMREEQT